MLRPPQLVILTAALLGMGVVAASWLPAAGAQEGNPTSLATSAQVILVKSCGSANCHGNETPFKFNVNQRETLIRNKVLVPKNAAASELIRRVETGSMPLAAPKLSDADIRTLRAWIDAGAPDFASGAAAVSARRFITETDIVRGILRDLQAAPERDREYLRYFSIAHLHNNAAISDADLQLYRNSLGKLANHLSWKREISVPRAVDAQKTVLRVDLRDFGWSEGTWKGLLAAYPYGFRPRNLRGELQQIHALSGADLPYLRVDWFVATASVPPLYHDILELPETLPELERKLGVDARQNLRQDRAVRAGLRNSGVSKNNRAVERHASAYGAYWKSFDFAGNRSEQNIFVNPLDFREDGGEFIFHLPNGLQGYLITNAQGKRLDVAPVEIVRDRTNPLDPIVVNGRSCMGCHFQGMKTFRDGVRAVIETQRRPHYDQEKALALYVPQPELDRLFQRDTDQFLAALRKTGSVAPKSEADEPINVLSNRYLGEVSAAQAAADVGLEPAEFRRRITNRGELEKRGINQLLAPNGGIKRDAWEEHFGAVVLEIGLADHVRPARPFSHPGAAIPAEARIRITLGSLDGPDPALAREVRQSLLLGLERSADLRVVAGDGDRNLRGTVAVNAREQVTITITDPRHNLRVELTGAREDLHFLAQQVSSELTYRITGARLPGGAPAAAAPVALAQRLDPVRELIRTVGEGGPVRLSLSVDRGPGSTYSGGEDVVVSLRADRDCHVAIYNIDSAGQVVLLFPNETVRDNRIPGNRLVSLVDRDGTSLIRVSRDGSFGIERVIAFATPGPMDFPGMKGGAGKFGAPIGGVQQLKEKGLKLKNQAQQPVAVGGGGGASNALVEFFTVR